MKCRVCGREIGLFGWNKHVEHHKREYLKALGENSVIWSQVDWEDVVRFFNPTNAKPSSKYQKPKFVTLQNWESKK